MHTLKGDSAACGLRELSELAHQFEDALSLEGTATQAAVAEIAFAAADVFTEMIAAYRNGTKLPSTKTSEQEDSGSDRGPRRAGQSVRETQEVAVKTRRRKHRVQRARSPASAGDALWTEYEKLAMTQGAGERPGCVSRGGQDRSALRHADCRDGNWYTTPSA